MTPCEGPNPTQEPEKQFCKQEAGPNSKSLAWAEQSLRGWARYREFGRTKALIRHEVEPARKWVGQPIDPITEAEQDAAQRRARDLDSDDYALVCRELAEFCKDQGHLRHLADLLFHCFEEGKAEPVAELVRTFKVWTPFEVIPVQLGEIGSARSATIWMESFLRHLAKVKEAGRVEEAKEA